MIARFLSTIYNNFPYMSLRTPIKLYAMTNPDMLKSSLPYPAGRTLVLSKMGGSSPVKPSPFGWKLSAFVKHSIGLLVSHYFRSIGIPCSLYIDDRHSSQIRLPRDSSLVRSLDPEKLNLISAQIASFLVCYTLVKLGYCIGLQKSILQPSQSVPYLGFDCDSRLQAFRLLPLKKQKFISLVEAILDSSHVSITDLQILAGNVNVHGSAGRQVIH